MRQENSGNIFIVHGHDEALLQQVKNVISEAGFHPIVLRDEVKSGAIQLYNFLEENAKITDFAVVLMTPDDGGFTRTKLDDLKWRARQNVILEAGYFLALLGSQKVVLLHQGGTEIPSDLLGAIRLECSDKDWRRKLIEKIENADINALLQMEVFDAGERTYGTVFGRVPFKFFHLTVTNKAQRRHAENCSVTLKRIRILSENQVLPIDMDRLKWDGEMNPEVRIKAGSSRNLAAICVTKDKIGDLFVYRTIDDTQGPWFLLNGTGEFVLEYDLYSDNFPTVNKAFKLKFDGTPEGFVLEELSE